MVFLFLFIESYRILESDNSFSNKSISDRGALLEQSPNLELCRKSSYLSKIHIFNVRDINFLEGGVVSHVGTLTGDG